MKIGNREIGGNSPPYIVAEVSCNHVGVFEHAHCLIEAAKESGADAVKFQCYTADEITLDCNKSDFLLKDGPWKDRKLHELYTRAQTPREWFPSLFTHARRMGIDMFCSVFSPDGVDFMEKQFNPPAYKIASMEITDIPLIEYVAKTGKPLIISTGMASDTEVVGAIDAAGWDFVLLRCVSGYPTPIEEANIGNGFINAGISDHTVGWEIPVAATALGACIIEKHLMLDKYLWDEGVDLPEDYNFSMKPIEFATMVSKVKAIWQSMQPSSGRKSEESSRQLRRSLYVVKDIKAGDKFTNENVRSIRPSYGMAPRDLPYVLNSLASQDIEAGTALKEEHLIGE